VRRVVVQGVLHPQDVALAAEEGVHHFGVELRAPAFDDDGAGVVVGERGVKGDKE
jgi:hypothetical protein